MSEDGDQNEWIEHIPFPLESVDIDGLSEGIDEVLEERTNETCKDIDQ